MSEIDAEVKWELGDVALPTLDNPRNGEDLTMLAPEQQMKLFYPHRPWENEPDHAEWYDASTGYKCRIHRSETLGHLNGYVGVFKGHPLHGMGYNEVDEEISVHGGLTYSHTEANGAVHWFGFDCGHGGDFSPGVAMLMIKARKEFMDDPKWNNWGEKNETYRTWEYVEGEVHKLVEALWKIERLTMLGGDHE